MNRSICCLLAFVFSAAVSLADNAADSFVGLAMADRVEDMKLAVEWEKASNSTNDLLNAASALYEGRTALLAAAELGLTNTVVWLAENKADLNKADSQGRTALHLSAAPGREVILSYLLASKCQVNLKDKSGRTPLHAAVAGGSVANVRRLLDYGANPNLRDNEGHTPFDDAKKLPGIPDEIRKLLSKSLAKP